MNFKKITKEIFISYKLFCADFSSMTANVFCLFRLVNILNSLIHSLWDFLLSEIAQVTEANQIASGNKN